MGNPYKHRNPIGTSWKCEICGKTHAARNFWTTYFVCHKWPEWSFKDECGDTVPFNSYRDEIDQGKEIEYAWELKCRSLASWESENPIFKIRCWCCNSWFTSFYDQPGYCYSCAITKEEEVA